jgi:hypothetical protein
MSGYLEKWRALLSDYPDKLQADIIADSTAFWRFPHHLDMLWTLAARQELVGLNGSFINNNLQEYARG